MTEIYGVSYGNGSVSLVGIELSIRPGLPRFIVGGLSAKNAPELRERIRNAYKSSKLPWPSGRVTVSLSPVGASKQGGLLDLAVVASLVCKPKEKTVFIGSVGIRGDVVSAPGLLGVLAFCARQGLPVIIPTIATDIANQVPGLRYAAIATIQDLRVLPRFTVSVGAEPELPEHTAYKIDSIRGHSQVKRALLIGVAGKHPILLWGPVGSGKTALVEAVHQLLPSLTQAEYLAAAERAARLGGDLPGKVRPFVEVPLHCSVPQLLGKAGYWFASQSGVLFLDELPEYLRATRESLRAPLQSLLQGKSGPAIVIAAGNLCKCGNKGTSQRCTCSGADAARYHHSLGAALLDRFALHVQVPWQGSDEWRAKHAVGETYASVINRVWGDKATRQDMQLSVESQKLIEKAVTALHLSGRARILIVEVAVTIAQIEEQHCVLPEHITEALQYRMRVT